jgi:ADP-ribose pyrophosphatase YjhB (NUDIX family)
MPHINYYLDPTVDVFVVYQEKVLLRMHDKYHKWLGVGGHIELGEDSNQAALREVKEEVGLEVKLYNPNHVPFETENHKELVSPVYLNRHRINDVHEHSSAIYFAVSDTDDLSKATQGREKAECRWFTYEEVDDPQYHISEEIRKYAKSALEALSVSGE